MKGNRWEKALPQDALEHLHGHLEEFPVSGKRNYTSDELSTRESSAKRFSLQNAH